MKTLLALLLLFSLQARALNFAQLQKIVVSERWNSLEAALPVLTARDPEYFKFHTLMYNSLSLQSSTFREPRAIVFGRDARFILTFNGNPSQAGGTSFETVEYSNHGFKFREVAFKYPGFNRADLQLEPAEIAYENENVVISKANPQKCTACHSQNANPIWASYFLWPGAYGSDDDDLSMIFDKSSWNPNNEGVFSRATEPMSQGRTMALRPGVADAELNGMIDYVTHKASHPRFKWLPPQFLEAAIARYARGEMLANLDYSAQSEAEYKRAGVPYWPSRPNLVLLDDLMELNQDRLITALRRAGFAPGSLAGLKWANLSPTNSNTGYSQWTIAEALLRVEQVLAGYKFLNLRPSHADLYKSLVAELSKEIGIQQEKVYNQQSTFGPGSLVYLPYTDTIGPGDPYDMRLGLAWVGPTVPFYKRLLKLKQPTNSDLIAFHLETSELLTDFTLAILLADRGVDLHQYSMNHRQESLNFHVGGLDEVYKYLGLSSSEGY